MLTDVDESGSDFDELRQNVQMICDFCDCWSILDLTSSVPPCLRIRSFCFVLGMETISVGLIRNSESRQYNSFILPFGITKVAQNASVFGEFCTI